MTNRPVRHDVAMTGEITLRGRILPVGGIREKVLGAHRAGIRTVILPLENEADLEDVPAPIVEEMRFVPVETADQALIEALALVSIPTRQERVIYQESVAGTGDVQEEPVRERRRAAHGTKRRVTGTATRRKTPKKPGRVLPKRK
jgi:predicted ATP-dependent protease